jgi:arabinogalactan endo-1,4-beta-galactosidase
MMRYTVLTNDEGNYRPALSNAIYEHAHAVAERYAKEGIAVEVIQHGRNGDCTCCVSRGDTLINTLRGNWEED